MRLFSPATKGESDVRLVSRLADGGRLVSSHGDGRRYLLRLDDAGYRLRQLAGCVPPAVGLFIRMHQRESVRRR